jgi:hypothetical protein
MQSLQLEDLFTHRPLALALTQDLRQLRENASQAESAELERLRRELQAVKDSAARCPIKINHYYR